MLLIGQVGFVLRKHPFPCLLQEHIYESPCRVYAGETFSTVFLQTSCFLVLGCDTQVPWVDVG